jgi:hypothetical protein
MSVIASEIEWRYSGGAANTDPNACLGGAISTAGGGLVDDNVDNDLFDDVSAAETLAGDIEYRGIYIKNTNGTFALTDASIFCTVNTTSTTEEIDIALADEAVSTTIETIANESTAPVGPTFSHPVAHGTLQLNGSTGLIAGAYKGVWFRRTVNAGTAAQAANTSTWKVQGDTL